MGVNIDEILSSLEQEKTAEANFADNIGSEAPAVSEDAPANPEEAPVAETDEELAKIAADCDAQGRVMARAFVAEINKVAAEENGEVAEEYYEGSETSEPTYEEEYVDQAEETDSGEKGAEADEYTPAERIVGSLYNGYFGEGE